MKNNSPVWSTVVSCLASRNVNTRARIDHGINAYSWMCHGINTDSWMCIALINTWENLFQEVLDVLNLMPEWSIPP
jgi:hypothetical protein